MLQIPVDPNLDSKLELIQDTLKRPGSWYTGLSIKKYLQQIVFSHYPDFDNPTLNSGRWSAYSHYNPFLAFKNLLDKHQITSGQTVLVHPLLPSFYVQELIQRNCHIYSLDIDSNSLAWPTDSFSDYILNLYEHNLKPDLIIHYDLNGLYDQITDNLKTSQEMVIPSMVVIDNYQINFELLKMFNTLKLGSVLWNFGESFLDQQLDAITNLHLPSNSWFVSWYLETRTTSILEHHLSSSQDKFLPILEALNYILLEQKSRLNLVSNLNSWFNKKYVFKSEFKNINQATDLIKENYANLSQSAIPDIIWELQLRFPEDYGQNPVDVLHQTSLLQTKAKEMYNFFVKQVALQPAGTLEIPPYQQHKVYLKYFFYTTEISKWLDFLTAKGVLAETLQPTHPIFSQHPDLSKAAFVSKYLIQVDTYSSLQANFV